jgi:hypothetical protein
MTGELVLRGVETVAAALDGEALTTAGKAGEVILRIVTLLAARRAVKATEIGAFARHADDYSVPKDIDDFVNGSQARPQGYEDLINEAVIARMKKLGIPEESIGYKGFYGKPFETHRVRGGGNVRPNGYFETKGINVDIAALDPLFEKGSSTWAKGSWKDRIDAMIVHEWEEVNSSKIGDVVLRGKHYPADHADSLLLAPETSLPISPRARQILREIRDYYLSGD